MFRYEVCAITIIILYTVTLFYTRIIFANLTKHLSDVYQNPIVTTVCDLVFLFSKFLFSYTLFLFQSNFYCLNSPQTLSCLINSQVDHLPSKQCVTGLSHTLAALFSKELRVLRSVTLPFFDA